MRPLFEVSLLAVTWIIGWLLLWRVPRLPPASSAAPGGRVSVVVPARNEAGRLPGLLAALAVQTRPADEVLVVDDDSEDETRAVAAAGGADVIAAPPLPDGWTGKTWACWTGAQRATGDVLMFLDADTEPEPDLLARLLDAVAHHPGLLSLMPYPHAATVRAPLGLLQRDLAHGNRGGVGAPLGALLVGGRAVPHTAGGVVSHLLPVDRAHGSWAGPVEGASRPGAPRAGEAVSTVATRRNLLIVLIDAGVWASWSALCGYVAHRIPASRLAQDRGLLRIRGFEAGGRFYERWLRIKRWKDRLPEAGALFREGFSKRRVSATDPAYLERFAVETRRAELTHWLILAASPWFFLWNPWWLGLAMLGYGVVANVPCLAIQRYNRARLLRMIPRPFAARTA